MKILILMTFLYSLTALAQSTTDRDKDLKGSSDPVEALKGFLMPLKNGTKGLSDSAKAAQNVLNGKSYEYANDELEKQGSAGKGELDHSNILSVLRSDMGDSGKLDKIQLIEKDDSKLNGFIQKYKYNLIFSNGNTRQLEFKLLKPTTNGGYFITEISEVP